MQISVAMWPGPRADASAYHPTRIYDVRYFPDRMQSPFESMLAFFVVVKLEGSAKWFHQITIRRLHVRCGRSYPVSGNSKQPLENTQVQR